MYFIGVEGWFIQPTANSVLFEAIFHLHMLILTHIIQTEFPIFINGTNYGMSSVAILYVEIYVLYIEIFMG